MRVANTLLALWMVAGTALAQLGLETGAGVVPVEAVAVAPGAGGREGLPEDFRVGFNQGWWLTHYSSQWTAAGFDRNHVRMLVEAAARFAGPGAVLRVWLFEGADNRGVLWDGEAAPRGRAPGDRHRGRPTGIDPAVVENFAWFLEVCQENGVQAYPTFFDGNVSDFSPGRHRRAEYWNVLNGKFDAGEGFRREVLGPLLEVMAARRGAVYAVDLVNEINNLVSDHWFEGGWTGAVRFVRRWRTFLRARVPGLPVTASLGHHTAVSDMLAARLPRSAVDFYDFHAYNDRGAVRRATEVAALAAEFPVVLGEFGQRSKAYDDDLQARATRAFVAEARRLGLRGAFAWRLWDIRPGENAEARLSFYSLGDWRPAAAALR